MKPHFELIQEAHPGLSFKLNQESRVLYDKLSGKAKFNFLLDIIKEKPNLCIDKSRQNALRSGVFVYYLMLSLDGRQIYKIANEFGNELIKVKMDFPSNHLPITNRMISIEFPDNIQFRSTELTGETIRGCYVVSVGNKDVNNEENSAISIHFLFPTYNSEGKHHFIQTYNVNISDTDKSFDQCVIESTRISTDASRYYFSDVNLIHYAVNCFLYIHSGNPDLREYKAPQSPSRKPKELRRWLRSTENTSLIPMILVGFGFKKPIQYSIESTTVRGHFRWQPYGEGRSKYKLIWIEAHSREFKKDEEH